MARIPASASKTSTPLPEGQDHNIGLLLGAASNGLLDVDLDAQEAIRAAPFFLPETGWKTGRQSKPRSHWWYTTDAPPDKASAPFEDIDEAMLVEIAVHQGADRGAARCSRMRQCIGWYECTEPAHVGVKELQQGVAQVAAAAIIGRHWPAEGGRQNAALALAGGLAKAGWEAEAVENFVRAVATAAEDDEVEMRCNTAGRSAEKAGDGKNVWGWPKLAGVLGNTAPPSWTRPARG